jgi:hypothetical protein
MPGQRLRLKAERVANSVANLVATLGEQRQRANQTAALLRPLSQPGEYLPHNGDPQRR